MPDWTNVLKYPPSEIFCHCGAIFHSHAMFDGNTGRMVLKSSCPGCGKSDAFWRHQPPRIRKPWISSRRQLQ